MGSTNAGLGAAQVENERSVYRWVAGLKGDLGGGWSWNAYYQDGRTHVRNTISNNVIRSRYALAIDAVVDPATGQTVCRSSLTASNGCSPLNLFGTNVASSEALAYVLGTAEQKTRIHEQVASASIQGEPISTWAGPVSLVAGAEWRREDFHATADAISQASDFWVGNFKPSDGTYSIKEAFGEIVVPLLKDSAIGDQLDFNGALRVTDYSTSGTVVTWKAGLTYDANSWLRLRGTRSRDIRAPNFNDLFQGGTSSSITVNDPQSGTTYTILRVIQGTTSLKPEKADTWAGGVVLRPAFLPGFSASVDYYDISIDDAITTPTQQQVVDGCQSGNATYCSLITRSDGIITQVITPGVNANNERLRGIDIDVSYRVPVTAGPLDGNLTLRGLGTHIITHTITSAFTGKYEYVGDYGGDPTYGTPAWRFVASADYSQGDFNISVQERFIGAGKVSNAYTSAQLADNHVDSVFYTDLNLSYDFHSFGGKQNLFIAVQNLFDRDPPVAPTTYGSIYGHIGTNSALYDVVGRFFRAGVKFQF